MLTDLYVSLYLMIILQAGIDVYLCTIIWFCDNKIKELEEKLKENKNG